MKKALLVERNEGVPVCASKHCQKELTGFELLNDERFCRKCRIAGKTLEWKCRTCKRTMSNSEYRETRLYCKECKKEKSVEVWWD